jgi:chain length determinant protein tyrosine kinase EpsG
MHTDVVPSELPQSAALPVKGDAKAIGDIIRQTNNLSADQVERILSYQMQHGVKFGEAAVALGFAKQEDVVWALAQQFDYHYANQSSQSIAAEVVVANKPFSDQAEIFRAIRGHLIRSVLSNPSARPALVMLSPNEGDGKSYFAANIAAALSQLGARTLLIDADLRKPRQHEMFAIDGKLGLSGILSGRNENKLIHSVQDLPELYVLPAGVVPPNPIELFERPTFGQLIADLKKKFDYIVVDAPSSAAGSDARVLAAHCGAALAVCRRNKTRIDAMQAMLSPLTINGQVKIAGVVMNEY